VKKDFLVETIVALLVLLFAYTSLSKLLEHDKFIFQMRLSHAPIIKQMAAFLSWFLPIVEIAIAVLLTASRTRLMGLYGSLALLVVFEGYIGAMLLSGQPLPCTCGGVISKLSWKGHLVFNLAFIVLAGIATIRIWRSNITTPDQNSEIDFSRV
jgi:hypothetical protein